MTESTNDQAKLEKVSAETQESISETDVIKEQRSLERQRHKHLLEIEEKEHQHFSEKVETVLTAVKEIIELSQSPVKEYQKRLFWHAVLKEVGKLVVVLVVSTGIIYLAMKKIIPENVFLPIITMIIGTYLGIQKNK